MKPQPRLSNHLQRELSDWRLWSTRALVIVAAAAAGLTVVCFTWMTEQALHHFFQLQAMAWWAPLLWTPAATAGVVWLTRRYWPGAAGSGIPQVMAALDEQVGEAHRGLFVSLRLTAAKMVLTASGLLAGLSLGREGPSVQIAAGVMAAASRWLPRRSGINVNSMLVAGGAAGIAAAFNAPLAGVMFAIEELARSPEHRSSGLLVAGIVLAGLIGVSVYGNGTYFGVIKVQQLDWHTLLPGLLVAVGAGLSGGLFARLLIESLDAVPRDRFSRFRQARPVLFAGACGLLVALIGVVSQGATFGSGYASTRAMLDETQNVSELYLLLKFVATWLTAWSGVPGGIFAPSLAIGAGLGHDIATLTQHPHATSLIALGMAGFLAAVTQAPLTAFIIVMEMVDGHAMVLSLMASALLASGVSRMVSRPLYATLATLQLGRLPAPPDPDRQLEPLEPLDPSPGSAAR
ncbi:MAG: hypothetical protein RIQ60_959 [Pseudomonadota bacterium]|jgi:H+/Cl- antiporter ClcA